MPHPFFLSARGEAASPEALAREGRYIVRLEACAFPDATQRQILEFGAEVRYGAPPLP